MYMSIIKIDTNNCLMKKNEELTHETLLEALNYQKRSDVNLLYRKDKDSMCVYSSMPLDQGKLLSRNYIVQNVIDIGSIYGKIQTDDIIKIFIRTSPSQKITIEGRRNSPRRTFVKKEDRLSWIENKLLESGAEIVVDAFGQKLIQENGKTEIQFSHFKKQSNRGSHTIYAYDYIVSVRIINIEAFLKRVAVGLGPYKSYGCGLLLLGA